ncbi:hypothetical protein HDU67_005577 [Dinochytrium kinnereticum]|nr:hypothetical protein HDU67_005577 [Dinochytrium kinnereticum]
MTTPNESDLNHSSGYNFMADLNMLAAFQTQHMQTQNPFDDSLMASMQLQAPSSSTDASFIQPPQQQDTNIIDLTDEDPHTHSAQNSQLFQLNPMNLTSPFYSATPQQLYAFSEPIEILRSAGFFNENATLGDSSASKRKLGDQQENSGTKRQKSTKDYSSPVVVQEESAGKSSSEDVIDLTDVTDMEDQALLNKALERAEERRRQRAASQKQLVCYGVVSTLVVELKHQVYITAIQGQREITVELVPEESIIHYGIYDLRVATLSGETLLAWMTYHDRDIKLNLQKFTASLYLTLYGMRYSGKEFGDYLLQHKITLGTSLRNSMVPNENPHQHLAISRVSSSSSSMSDAGSSGADAKSQIDAIYNSLTSAEDLPEMEPDGNLTTPMYKHQKQALYFMVKKEEQVDFTKFDPKHSLWQYENRSYRNVITNQRAPNQPNQMKGGILADDMGLGKTIEVISLLLKEKATPENYSLTDRKFKSSGTLIVCPLSTVQNWEEQVAAHVRTDHLKINIYHGPNRCQDPNVLAKYDIVLTTYSVLSIEYSKDIKSGAVDPEAPKDAAWTSPLLSIQWFRIVLDEAHIIKDPNTGQAKAACCLSADRRWCLTDLFSLIKFLGLQPFNARSAWNQFISKPARFATNSIGVHRLQTLMKSITLRRTKTQKIDGKPILTLPERIDSTLMITLSPSEQTLYNHVHQRAKAVFHGLQQSGTVMRNYVHLLEIILRMRQICVHPLLCKDSDLEFKDPGSQDNGPLTKSKAFHLFSLLKDSGDDKCTVCDASMESLGEVGRGLYLAKCGHLFCSECLATLTSQSQSTACVNCGLGFERKDLFELKDLDGDFEDESGKFIELKPTAMEFRYSSKVLALVQDLDTARQESSQRGEPAPKSVIFSQWTNLLDLITPALVESGFLYTRVDGKMNRNERSNAITRFKQDPTVPVLLLSLKAGGVGLNLTIANRVYIMEPYWNPAVEQQAVDRVHRMGQTRTVHAIRFIAKGTIEDSILELQRRKMRLAEMAFEKRGAEGDDDGLGKKGQKRAKARENKEELARQRMLDLNLLFQ